MFFSPANPDLQPGHLWIWHCDVTAQLITDVTEEAKKFGQVVGVAVPAPPPTVAPHEPGRVYIKYTTTAEAEAAKEVIARTRTCLTHF